MADSKKLSKCGVAFAMGVTWGLGTLILGLVAWKYQYGMPVVNLLASIYPKFAATMEGSLIGAGWGFVDGFIGGLVFAIVYNTCCCCCPKSKG